ncbi:hypothetical protein HPB48_011926 [Haemaphysalis longicornis]|uniref:CCHC-type domain-containing protein n=1 Tax=Haemaphysalis longicornis TaxID=44386 RepID=A0A9J6FWY7_HAELO|nr:hypothetical protein HPB48_011926 [Haemaphysalis longicornis]
MQDSTRPLQPITTDASPFFQPPASDAAAPSPITLSAMADPASQNLEVVSANAAMPAPNAVSGADSAGPTAPLRASAFLTADCAAIASPTMTLAAEQVKSPAPPPTASPLDAAAGTGPFIATPSTVCSVTQFLRSAASSYDRQEHSIKPAVPPTEDASAEMDLTQPPGDDATTQSSENAWTTVGSARKPASTARSRTELITVGIQLPPGTLTPKLPLYDLLTAIASAAQLSSQTSEEITLQAKPTQSLVFLKTHSPLTAHLLLSLSHVRLHGKTISIKPYARSPPISCLGVIHNVGGHFTPPQIMQELESYTTDILAARMMGSTQSVLITFAGTVIPRFVYFKRVAFRCRPHKPKPPTCTRCLALGHRAHQCPQHCAPAKCRRCAAPLPPDPSTHVCSQPWCIHCKVNTHPSLDPTCPFLLEKQRACAKAAFERRIALRRVTQDTPCLPSSKPASDSPVTSQPGSYAAKLKGPSVPPPASSNAPPSPSLNEENRHSFDLRLAMLERQLREQQRVSQELQQQIQSLTETLQATTTCLTSQLAQLNQHLATFTTAPSATQLMPLADLVESTSTAQHTRLVQLETSILKVLTALNAQSEQLKSFGSIAISLQESLPPAKKKDRPSTSTAT